MDVIHVAFFVNRALNVTTEDGKHSFYSFPSVGPPSFQLMVRPTNKFLGAKENLIESADDAVIDDFSEGLCTLIFLFILVRNSNYRNHRYVTTPIAQVENIFLVRVCQ